MRSVPVVAKAGVTGSPETLLLRHSYAMPIPRQIPHPMAMSSQMRSRESASAAGVLAGRAGGRRHLLSLQRSSRDRRPPHLKVSVVLVAGSVITVARKAGRWCQRMRPSRPHGKTALPRPLIRLCRKISAAMFIPVRRALIGTPGLMAARTCMPRSISAPTIAVC
ncbi:hypothetical protein DSM25559_1502 [Agrobacterium rosae]|uniref:Uncharacterized protein n=1 Tax=Agrobacterium rosae TaxID=1972867 RepID=A0A1R3TGI6_9HYPH|nr:hypothetical protein DSM25559_1502 [Agrobacterium rosae]